MANEPSTSNLPATIGNAVAGIPQSLVPASIKALDRLVGAVIDIPVAWLNQQKAKIEAQTDAFAAVEQAIGKAVANEVGSDPETVQRAVEVLVRKSYRKQINREAVAVAMIEDLSESDSAPQAPEQLPASVDDDWLNVFERYAEDATTEKMQKLWGRVLAGEVRKPGRYSMRTLRFLSEFSQADAILFAEFCECSFGDFAPKELVKTGDDIRTLIYLESAGLIQGASGLGLTWSTTFNEHGNASLREGALLIVMKGKPGGKVSHSCCILTPLGQEVMSLLPGRIPRAAARKVGLALRSDAIESAYIATELSASTQLTAMEILWEKDQSNPVAG